MKKIYYTQWGFLVAATSLLGNYVFFLNKGLDQQGTIYAICAIPCMILFLWLYREDQKRQKLFDRYQNHKYREESDAYLASLADEEIKFFYASCEKKFLEKELRYYEDQIKELQKNGRHLKKLEVYQHLFVRLMDFQGK